jgi:hypothetical protein
MAGDLQERRTEIHPREGAAVTAPHQFAGKFAITATQVKDGFVACQAIHHPHYPGLQVQARGREFVPEGLVELFIQRKQPRNGLAFHNQSHYTV